MTAEKILIRDRLTWTNYLMIGIYSYLINILGPITPFLQDEMALSYTVSSLHFSAFAFGMILAGLSVERFVGYFGRQRVFWGGSAGMMLGVLLLLLGQSPIITITAALLMGTLGSLTFSLVPILLSHHHPKASLRTLTEANLLGSITAFVAPFAVSVFSSWSLGWRTALILMPITWVLLWLGFHRQELPEPQIEPQSVPTSPLNKRFWLRWFVVFLVVGIEFCVLFWGSNYLIEAYNLSSVDAAGAITFVLLGMFGGRALGSFFLDNYPIRLRFFGSLGLIVVGGLLLLSNPIAFLPFVLFLIGSGIANLYPIAFDAGLSEITHHRDAASSRLVMASGVAILSLPLLVGGFADRIGIIQILPLVILILLIMSATLFTWLDRHPTHL